MKIRSIADLERASEDLECTKSAKSKNVKFDNFITEEWKRMKYNSLANADYFIIKISKFLFDSKLAITESMAHGEQ